MEFDVARAIAAPVDRVAARCLVAGRAATAPKAGLTDIAASPGAGRLDPL